MKRPYVLKVAMRTKKIWLTKQKVMDYIHTLFVGKDTHVKYLCAIILSQKFIKSRGCCHLIIECWPFLILWRKNTINPQWIISTNRPPFSRQRTITRKILTNDVTIKGMRGIPACVKQEELNSKKSHIDTKENSKVSSSGRVSKMYQPYWS